ncbi:ankyrin repeat domain-containing protein [bacterium]|nr:ankyrin repeat domain-containing protein [bacterium]MBP5590254.1 ankyrin repeat domain-containing protein [bacterium]
MKRFFLLFSVFLFCVSCGSRERTAPSVYKSRDQLTVLGYEFSEEDFEKAVKEKRSDIVKLFIDAGMSPNTTFKAGKYQIPVIFYAINSGDEMTFQVLLHSKADLQASVEGVSVITKAAEKGTPEMISLIIKSGVDINSEGYDMMTPLMTAIESENNGTAWFLIQSGANVNAADINGVTPLMRAVGKGNIDIVRELIKKGADVNAKMKNGTKTSKFIGGKEKEAMEVLLRDAGAEF